MKTATPGRALRLLLVDDDDVDRERLRRMLRQTGLAVAIAEAGSGREAIEKLREAEFDCLILDDQLGDTTGTELIAEMKPLLDRPLPVVMVSGAGDERTAIAAMREGVFDYLRKDRLEAAQLGAAIEGGLRRAQLETERSEAQNRLAHMGLYDALTGLANRNLFFDRLERAILAAGRGAHFALLMIDLDRFKDVNDSFGHAVGDRLLAELGRRLQQVARKSDNFARLGGDEFAALVMGIDTAAAANIIAEKIVDAVRKPFAIENQLVTVGVSIGIALVPAHGTEGQQLLAKADEAMYRAKRGSQGYQIFSPVGRGGGDSGPLVLASGLSDALANGEVFLHFQPKIDLGTGALCGVEALARWGSPRFGPVPPGEFIPAAERGSMIGTLTYAILEMALDQARDWRDQGWPVPVAVNLSPRLFDDPSLARRIGRALAARALPPDSLMLEITETALMTSPLRAAAAIAELHSAGIGISIDDFGTGYTSLKYLRDFPIAEIKIDGLFVKDLTIGSRDASIVHSLSVLARGFEINLVAECVEQEESWPLLRVLGCAMGQGYSIARPMLAESVPGWWARWRSASEAAWYDPTPGLSPTFAASA
jgi:diguanylate cyclase (GGDEF)-like protein